LTRPLRPSLLPPLAFLVRLLASRKDAEVIGAARAIGRQLTAAGLGFDDLADHVERTAAKPYETPRQLSPAKPGSNRAKAWTPPIHVNLDDEARAALLATLVEALADVRLKGWARRDIAALVERLERRDPAPTRRMLDRAQEFVAILREDAQ